MSVILEEQLKQAKEKYAAEKKQCFSKEQEIKKMKEKLTKLDNQVLDETKEIKKKIETEKIKIAQSLFIEYNKEYNKKMEEAQAFLKAQMQDQMAAVYRERVNDMVLQQGVAGAAGAAVLAQQGAGAAGALPTTPVNFTSAVAFS